MPQQSLDIPEFLKIPAAERKAAWDAHRVTALGPEKQTSEAEWRRNRDKHYEEEATAHVRSGEQDT